jgi:GNAT superfamily N-acetyltransferase
MARFRRSGLADIDHRRLASVPDVLIRQATPADAAELVRLRAVMLRSIDTSRWNDDWREPARNTLTGLLGQPEPTLAAFVVDRPAGEGLAACALGSIEQRLGNPANPDGRVGYVYNVVTDPDMRRRGYSRACMSTLLDWFRQRGVRAVDLRASADGASLYESLGFERSREPGMRLKFS